MQLRQTGIATAPSLDRAEFSHRERTQWEVVWAAVGQSMVDAAQDVDMGNGAHQAVLKTTRFGVGRDIEERHTVTVSSVRPLEVCGVVLPFAHRTPLMAISLALSGEPDPTVGNLIILIRSEGLRDVAVEMGLKVHQLIAERNLTRFEPLAPFWIEVSPKLR